MIKVGQTFTVEYPFVRIPKDEIWLISQSYSDVNPWRPGVLFRHTWNDDAEAYCDGIGQMILTVIGTAYPKPFPTRVMYTRKWRDPDGREFGKRRLLISTLGKFNQLCRGYAHAFVRCG